jgi:hypothetical protein
MIFGLSSVTSAITASATARRSKKMAAIFPESGVRSIRITLKPSSSITGFKNFDWKRSTSSVNRLRNKARVELERVAGGTELVLVNIAVVTRATAGGVATGVSAGW